VDSRAAKERAAKFPDPMVLEMEKTTPGIDYALAPPILALVRFGKWDDVLAVPAPPSEMRYLAAMRHFARAIAYAKKKKTEEAKKEATALRLFTEKIRDEEMLGPRNSAKG